MGSDREPDADAEAERTRAGKRGGDLVNEDLEVGFDERFERRWIVVQNFGLLLMAGFVLCCFGGLLGRGPFSHRSATAADHSLDVDYEPVVREQTGTQITLHVPNATAVPRQVDLFVPGQMVEPMGLSSVQPRPDAAVAAKNGMVLRFTVAPRQAGAPIRLQTMPGKFGTVRMRAWLGDGPADAIGADAPDPSHAVRWTQLVLP